VRWDLIEKFEVLKKGAYSRAFKTFSGTEDFFKDHFPGKPLVPEPLLIEMIAQAGGVLFGLGLDFQKEVILAKVSKADFLKSVAPPCRLEVQARLEEEREEGAWIDGEVLSENEPVARARILLVTMDALEGVDAQKIVFNDDFLRHFDIYNIAKKSEMRV
jgi:3-hydroxyacyl-[acyl-carrier-protein] dehydratase